MAKNLVYHFNRLQYDLGSRTHLMGIVNTTPDSFSDGGKYFDADQAVHHALQLIEDGADFIDIGGESTRPGSDPVSIDEEIRRTIPVIERLVQSTAIPISIDTYKSQVAEAALQAGAALVNDISGLTSDERMASLTARYEASIILMHMQGKPKTMQQDPVYADVTVEVLEFLATQVEKARAAGIQQIIVDPGIGFGKKFEHNIQLLRDLSRFRELGCPLLVGPSRKSFLGVILDLPVEQRLEGTAAAVTASILRGAHIIRVHDVKEMKRVARVSDVLKQNLSQYPE